VSALRNRRYITAPPESGLLSVDGSWSPGIFQILRSRHDPVRFGERRRQLYGTVGAMRIFGTTMVMATGAEAAEQILLDRGKAFASGSAWELIIGPFFPRGLMLLDSTEHHAHRRIMQSALTSTQTAADFSRLQPEIRKALSVIPPGRMLLYPFFRDLALRLAVETFVAVPLTPAQYDQLAKTFTTTVRAGTSLIRFPIPRSRYARGVTSRRELEDFFRLHLQEKRANATPDLFSRLCHSVVDGYELSDADVVNHMIFLLMAAHDTTQVAMTQLTYRLASNRGWQNRVVEECANLPEELTYENVSAAQVPQLDRVLRESLRMCPPVPAIPRRAIRDTEVIGRFIPAGTRVTIPSLPNHRNEAVWEDPHRFDPDRFLPERLTEVHRFAWCPFGGGVHKCLGMHFALAEIKAVIVQLLRSFELSVPIGYEIPMDYSALPVPKDGLPVTLTPRSSTRILNTPS
jgi:cytochrome P450